MKNKLLTTDQLIKKEIERLHRRGSGDFQSLMRQVNTHHAKIKKIELNDAQLASMYLKAHSTEHRLFYDLWSRGTGKTTVIGAEVREIAATMPRSVGQFIAPSYKMFLTRVIPSLVAGLEMNGLYQGLHYFVGEKPPKSWVMGGFDLPYQPPRDFGRFVTLFNGCGFHMISQDVAGDGRGLNTDFQIGDEDAMNDWSIIAENNLPALRGSKSKVFEGKPYFLKKFHHSSMPLTEGGRWVFNFQERNHHEPTICVVEADSSLNAHNLAPGYLENARKECLNEVTYNAEYLNLRPPTIGMDSFYPHFSERKHGYRPEYNGYYQKIGQSEDCRGDADLTRGVSLTLGVDFGHAINSLIVSQRLTSPRPELRVLKNMYAIGSEGKIQDDLFEAFNDYYRYHKATNNHLFVYYDNFGNVSTGHTLETRAQQMATQLRRMGWRVTLLTKGGRNPQYDKKFAIYERMLAEKDPRLPIFRMNILNCKELIVSMSNAKLKPRSNGGVEKDKSSERRLLAKGERQFATDLSDALDTIVYGILADMIDFGEEVLPNMRVSGSSI